MALYRIQCTLQLATNLPEDVSQNTWYVQNMEHVPDDTATTVAWKTFLDTLWQPPANSIADTGHFVRCYDMADPEPRAPKWEIPFALDDPATEPTLPTELAICVSYKAAPVSGQDPANRRGRMYLGPLSTAFNDDGLVLSTIPPNIVAAFQAFVQDLLDDDSQFVIYSPTLVIASTPAEVWVDNAFDVQRRRGQYATSRSVGVL